MLNVAVFTMVYNEDKMMPIWRRHYAKQFGEKNCFVIDHGSTDGSTDDLGECNIIRLPRSPQDNDRRTAFVGEILSSFLRYYDYVIYTDCDEMLVVDPEYHASIIDFLEAERPRSVTSIGLDVLHMIDDEDPIDGTKLISHQRSYLHYSSAMNKLSISGVPVKWSPGFHSGLENPNFRNLYLFHLRYFDISSTLYRLGTTRSMSWALAHAGQHQRVSDETMVSWVQNWNRLPVVHDDLSTRKGGLISNYIEEFTETGKSTGQDQPLQVNTTTFGSELIKIPERFIGSF